MAARDDYCSRCGARLGECTCDAERGRHDLEEALGRDRRRDDEVEEMHDQVAALARRVQEEIRGHLEQTPKCPHCAACPALVSSLASAQRACGDIIASLNALAQLAEASRHLAKGPTLRVLAAAAQRCQGTLQSVAARLGGVLHCVAVAHPSADPGCAQTYQPLPAAEAARRDA